MNGEHQFGRGKHTSMETDGRWFPCQISSEKKATGNSGDMANVCVCVCAHTTISIEWNWIVCSPTELLLLLLTIFFFWEKTQNTKAFINSKEMESEERTKANIFWFFSNVTFRKIVFNWTDSYLFPPLKLKVSEERPQEDGAK